jgi:hypothetical protein
MRRFLLGALLGAWSCLAAAQTTLPFQPADVITGQAAKVYRLTAGNSSTPFQLPAIGIPTGRVQVTVVNEGSNGICVARGSTQSAVATLTIPALGTGTIGAAGNCSTINPGNALIWTVWDGPWFNIQALSGTSNVSIELGLGN